MLNRSAIRVALCVASLLGAAWASAQSTAPAQDVPTPRAANGKPDLTGMWDPPLSAVTALLLAPQSVSGQKANEAFSVLPSRNGDLNNFEFDFRLLQRNGTNLPLYKPKYWDKVNELELNSIKTDTAFHCKPMGIPRIGPPVKIVQTPNELILFHAATFQVNQTRVVPLRDKHTEDELLQETWMGIGVAHWEGDTLVIDNRGFNQDTWLGGGSPGAGFFHTADLRVVERLTRKGNTLLYEVTAEDPAVLAQPWVLAPVTLQISRRRPGPALEEEPPCDERDTEFIVIPTR